MPWGKMDDKFHRNRKVRALRRLGSKGREALGVWTFWWSWCLDDGGDFDGFVPAEELDAAEMKAGALLVEVGLWDAAEEGFRFHDFNEYNPTRGQVENKREADRRRQQELRDKQRESRNVSQRDTDRDSQPESRPESLPRASRPGPALPVPGGDSAPPAFEPWAVLWGIWVDVALDGIPAGSVAGSKHGLEAAWKACEAREPGAPGALFEAAAKAYVGDCAARSKRPTLRFLLSDLGEWLAKPGGSNGGGFNPYGGLEVLR